MPRLLDTHAWIWWVTEDARLSRKAKAEISRAVEDRDLLLSMISIWELAKKVEKGQLTLDRDLNDWLDLALTPGSLQLVELDRRILVESCRLPKPFHGDPADQIIVSTARTYTAVLITKDRRIRNYSQVHTLW
ncbi:MAG TPA: type II toxin-antitoxin system VapC family toxin [Terriglobia bacterium]|jgi:PIN domain nuclease of toxin-antitoxin system